ncbi:MAG: hypothetical protein ACR2PW_07615 [Gammaproteobacteria bacterium]
MQPSAYLKTPLSLGALLGALLLIPSVSIGQVSIFDEGLSNDNPFDEDFDDEYSDDFEDEFDDELDESNNSDYVELEPQRQNPPSIRNRTLRASEQRQSTSARRNPRAATRSNRQDASLEPVFFEITKGSLRANIRQLANSVGWELVGWDSTIRRGNAVLDWSILSSYTLEADSLDDALEQLIAPYGLHARLHEPDQVVAIYLADKVRFQIRK